MKKLSVAVCLILILVGSPDAALPQDDLGFRFVRVKYEDYGRRGWNRYGRGAWATDWPTSDINLHEAIERTTLLTLTGEPLVLTFYDERIFEYPVVYLTEPGYWKIDDEEIKNMQKYFERGGFLIIDDFHDYGGFGPQWYNMYNNMKMVLPDKEPVPLPNDHPIWTVYYDIDPVEAASTKWDFSRYDDQYYAIFDDNGRMMVVICYNQDIGDGWEHPFGRRILPEASTVSFQMAINFIIYALTH
jgi:hypothetical protein